MDYRRMKMKGIKHSGVYLEIPEDIYRQVKLYALWRNMTIKGYILEGIIEKMTREKSYKS